jgi:hypothetical protein
MKSMDQARYVSLSHSRSSAELTLFPFLQAEETKDSKKKGLTVDISGPDNVQPAPV